MRKSLFLLAPLALTACLMIFPMTVFANCGSCGTGAGASHADHAGHSHADQGKDTAAAMNMMAEFANCHVCKNLMPYMETLMPVMSMEVIDLNNGLAVMHNVSDPAKLETFREMSAKMRTAGESCMAMSTADAKNDLCSPCFTMYEITAAGGTMSMGDTATGDIMVFTGTDPAAQEKIGELKQVCDAQVAMTQ